MATTEPYADRLERWSVLNSRFERTLLKYRKAGNCRLDCGPVLKTRQSPRTRLERIIVNALIEIQIISRIDRCLPLPSTSYRVSPQSVISDGYRMRREFGQSASIFSIADVAESSDLRCQTCLRSHPTAGAPTILPQYAPSLCRPALPARGARFPSSFSSSQTQSLFDECERGNIPYDQILSDDWKND